MTAQTTERPETPGRGNDPPQARWRRWLRLATIDAHPLQHRDFRLLYIGQGVSYAGGRIRDVALPFQVYQLTHSSLAVGLMGLAEIVPILLLAFLGGALADAQDRRRMVQITELAFAVMSGLLLINALLPTPQLWPLFVVGAAMAGLDALQRPSLDALIPRLVPREEITAASALQELQGTVGQIAAPALAGVLIAVIGLPGAYGIDVATFMISLLALRLMRAAPPPADAERPSLRRVLEGLRYARSRQELLGTYLVDMVAMFFGMPMALFPAIATQYGGARALGLLYAAPAVGSFLATLTSRWAGHVHRHGLAVAISAAVWGTAILGFGLSNRLPLSLAFLALAGGADTLSALFRSTIWNQTIPDSLRGRLAGIELISYSSGPTLGNVESGLVAALASVRVSLISGGALCVVGVVLCAAALPRFLSYDSRHGAEA